MEKSNNKLIIKFFYPVSGEMLLPCSHLDWGHSFPKNKSDPWDMIEMILSPLSCFSGSAYFGFV